MVVNESLSEWLGDNFFGTGLTYSAHPLACASAIATIQTYRDEGLIENAAALGDYLSTVLSEFAKRHPAIGDIRGAGLFWALELVKDRATREPLVPFRARASENEPIQRVHKAATDQGLVLHGRFNIIGIAPPLVITREQLDEAVSIIDDVLSVADEYYTG
jgi:taurine--2-oxoglutarate transaminase